MCNRKKINNICVGVGEDVRAEQNLRPPLRYHNKKKKSNKKMKIKKK